MAKRKLTVPLMERADAGNHDLNGICVSGRSLELLMEIKGLLEPLAEFLREKMPVIEIRTFPTGSRNT